MLLDTVFNLSKKVLSDVENKVLEKGLDYALIQNKINEPESKKDFENLCRQMRLKWFFRNELTPSFSKTPAFKTNLFWNPPKGHPCLQVYLSQVEKEPLELVVSHLGYSNFIREEWKAIRSLADNRSIIIKKADKGSGIVVWERIDSIVAAEKQLGGGGVKIYTRMLILVIEFFGILQIRVIKYLGVLSAKAKLVKKNSSSSISESY